MLFNSPQFAIFLPLVFVIYWFLTNANRKVQNVILLIGSYVFYGWWDWRFLCLLLLLTTSNYFIGIGIAKTKQSHLKTFWLITGVIVNLGVLGFFKYYNFFIDGLIDMISLIGYDLPRSSTRIILPVGISFYTFLSLSYIIDIYKEQIHANKNFIEVLLSLSFFPIILAGPIQRPSSLLTQIAKKREFSYNDGIDGLKQMLWGLFTKVGIADNLSVYVDEFFLNPSTFSGSTLLLGAAFYSIQIYADFSGYSNMAIGMAKLFGFSLIRNFAYPYFSRDIAEFWKRWHISLVTWFRDYVFLPISFGLSGRIKLEKVFFIKTDIFIYIVASSIVWFLTGLWHGANYTFIIWGTIHGLLLILYHIQKKPRKRVLKSLGLTNEHTIIRAFEYIFTMSLIMIAWVFFRAHSLGEALLYLDGIFSKSVLSIPKFPGMTRGLIIIFLSISFIVVEWLGRKYEYAIANIESSLPKIARWTFYYTLIVIVFLFGSREQQFIYFQF